MLSTIIPIVLLIIAAGVLIFISRELEAHRRRKLAGILMMLLAILFMISQISYLWHPAAPRKNFGGIFGFYSSFALFWMIGLYFFIVPLLLIYAGFIFLTRKEDVLNLKLLYAVPIGLITDILLARFFPVPIINSQAVGLHAGGNLGRLTGTFVFDFFGDAGAFLIIGFAIIMIAFMMVKEKLLPRVHITQPKPPAAKPKPERKEPERTAVDPAPDAATAGTGSQVRRARRKTVEIDFQNEFLNILQDPHTDTTVDRETLQKEAELLTSRLSEFGVAGRVTGVESGPVISRYEFEPAPGVKVNQIANLDNDLALALKATRIRIIAPIPGKSAVGIEVPNHERRLVCLKSGLHDDKYIKNRSPLAIVLGEDITGNPVSDDIARMPHMLIAGTTGSGKSVCVNTIILSLLYHSGFRQLRFLMIDPKRLELPMYNPIPHLLRPVVTEPSHAVKELEKIVSIMEMRYREFAREGVRDIDGYNEKMLKHKKEIKPYILVVVDELADLMLTAPSEIEENITRLAQMSRAVGIHLVLATQRPSVDVITGLIKANFPCRSAFQVASKTDSRTILDMNGAESLLGKGDMLFLPPGIGTPVRLHGAYVSTDETKGISDLIARNYLYELLADVECDIEEVTRTIVDEELWTILIDRKDPAFDEKRQMLSNIMPADRIDEIVNRGYYPVLGEIAVREEKPEEPSDLGIDPMFPEAARLVFNHQIASVSLLQRRLGLGYARAGRIIDQLESAGIVEPFQGSKSRKVLIERPEELDSILKKYAKQITY